MGNSMKSIFPFLPRPIKYFILLVLLANIRSWPFSWHLRVFAPFLRIRLYQLYLAATRQPRKVKLEYKESLVPLGENPVDFISVYDGWAGPDDCDYNLHLSNSSYPKNLDCARFKMAIAMFPSFLDQGGNILLGGTHFNFVREIPLGSRFQIRMKLLAWDKKWLYVSGQYVIPPKDKDAWKDRKGKRPETLSQGVSRALGGAADEMGDEISSTVLGIPSMSTTPATPSGSVTPTDSNPSPASPAASSGSPNSTETSTPGTPRVTKDGWTIACTSISVLCCKFGRSTVPPALALAVSGLMFHGKEEWNVLKRMRATGEIKHLLKGGWRNVTPESNGPMGKGLWWEEVMRREGVLEEVEKRLQGGLGSIRQSMEYAGSLC